MLSDQTLAYLVNELFLSLVGNVGQFKSSVKVSKCRLIVPLDPFENLMRRVMISDH